jgi:hypothetical protein
LFESKRNLVFYTLFILTLFFSVMILLTPPGSSNKRFGELSARQNTENSQSNSIQSNNVEPPEQIAIK